MSESSEYVRDRSAQMLALAGARAAEPSEFVAGGEWSLRFGGYRHAKVISVASGACWLRTEHAEPVLLEAGESYLLAGGGSYETSSDLRLRPGAGAVAYTGARDGIAHYAVGRETGTRLIGGNFVFDDAAGARLLLGSVPSGARLGSDVLATLTLLAAEAMTPGSAGAALRWHLTQVLCLQILRNVGMPGQDQQIGAALAAMRDRPGFGWTVARLAAEAGLSRTVFATRFKAQVGLAPMEYLLRQRIDGASRELASGRTVASVAARWGYASESAFSAAFKRVTGRRPAARLRG
jgi:AraC-like DNA-binding protein